MLGVVVTAEGVYNRALARAGRLHDLGVVAAASSRDQSVLTALDALLGSTAPAGDTAPAFTAAEAAPIRAAVAKLRGVVSATTTVLNQTVDATGAFLVKTVNHSITLARAVNQADGQFFASVIAAETASLTQAFDFRAQYERAVNLADEGYVGQLMSGMGASGIVDALVDAGRDQKLGAIDFAEGDHYSSIKRRC